MSEHMLTFLQDPHELEWVMHHRVEALGHPIVTFDLELHCELAERGIDHLTPWDLVGPDDRAVLEQIEQSVQAFWRDHAVVWHRGVNLLAIAAHRHVSALSRMIWVGFTVERAIAERKPDRILLFECANAHGLEQPSDHRRLPLLFGIVESIARDLNVQIERLAEESTRRFVDHASTQAHQVDLPMVDDSSWGDHPFVLLSGSGHDLERQLPVIQRIESAGALRAIQVYRHADDTTLDRLKANGHLVVHDSQLRHSSAVDVKDASRRGLREFNAALASVKKQSTCSFARSIPQSHLDFVFGPYAEKLASHVQRWSEFLDRHRPAAFIGHYPDAAMELAHRRNIPTLLLPHGGLSIGDAPWYRSMPKVTMGVEGKAHVEQLRVLGIDQDRIEVLDLGAAQTVPRDGTTRNPSDPFNLLLVTSRLADHAHDAELPGLNWKAAIRSLEDVFNIAQIRPNWRFTIKTHPRYDHIELYHRMNRTLPEGKRFAIESRKTLADCLASADVTVFANVTSTAILEASRSGKPVILLRERSVLSHRNPRDKLLTGWPTVSSVGELTNRLDELASDVQAYTAAANETANALANFYGQPPVPGSLLQFIRRMKKARITAEGEPCPLVGIT
ncbi:MAG: hypothetical protein R3E58_00760 [Phycisphaerae bacterium]